MVQLTVTPAMLEAIEYCQTHELRSPDEDGIAVHSYALGNPITHGTIIGIANLVKGHVATDQGSSKPAHDLASLLKGSQVYIEPPKPKPEPTSEYKELMARLREEEEERQYERMINPPLPMQAFGQRFPNSNYAHLFPQVSKQEEDDEVTFADVNRQVALIFNVLISIVACAAAIWMATRYWPIPQRLGASMGGGGLVGVAEVVVYAGYLRRVKEAKQKEKRKVEKKEIIETWVLEPKPKSPDSKETTILPKVETSSARKRLNRKEEPK